MWPQIRAAAANGKQEQPDTRSSAERQVRVVAHEHRPGESKHDERNSNQDRRFFNLVVSHAEHSPHGHIEEALEDSITRAAEHHAIDLDGKRKDCGRSFPALDEGNPIADQQQYKREQEDTP